MKNKAYFIHRLAQLKGLDPESEEVKSWSDRKIVDLLVEIRDTRDKPEPEPEPENIPDVTVMSRVRGFNRS